MGLRNYLRRRHEREKAIPDPGSVDFESAVSTSALSDGGSESGWTSVGDARSVDELAQRAARRLGAGREAEVGSGQSINLRGSGAGEQLEKVLEQHGVDPSEEQTVDVSAVPGLGDAIMAALAGAGVNLPGPVQNVGGGFGIAIDADIPAQIEALAIARDEGRITAAEFEAQRQRLLSG